MEKSHQLPFVVSLTGGIGCGKTVVSNRLAQLGAHVIDSDVIAHQITQAHGAAILPIRQAFGDQVIDQDGKMDRAKMRELVFSDPKAKKQLEQITHPLIFQAMQALLIETVGRFPYALLVIPLLVEAGHWLGQSDRVLVVDCPVETQISRVQSRSQLSRQAVLAMINSQATRNDRLAIADDVVFNDGTLDSVLWCCDRLHINYVEYAAQDVASPSPI